METNFFISTPILSFRKPGSV